MSVSLTKLVNGKRSVNDTLRNEQMVKCSRCEQAYRLRYSDNERHWLSPWLVKAERAIRESHRQDKHELPGVELSW